MITFSTIAKYFKFFGTKKVLAESDWVFIEKFCSKTELNELVKSFKKEKIDLEEFFFGTLTIREALNFIIQNSHKSIIIPPLPFLSFGATIPMFAFTLFLAITKQYNAD